eukprot:5177786-Amphidinium_carterae.1
MTPCSNHSLGLGAKSRWNLYSTCARARQTLLIVTYWHILEAQLCPQPESQDEEDEEVDKQYVIAPTPVQVLVTQSLDVACSVSRQFRLSQVKFIQTWHSRTICRLKVHSVNP